MLGVPVVKMAVPRERDRISKPENQSAFGDVFFFLRTIKSSSIDSRSFIDARGKKGRKKFIASDCSMDQDGIEYQLPIYSASSRQTLNRMAQANTFLS